MENGIDQGEIMSPLLWIIYYDPLFSKIRKERGCGYEMKHNWKQDIRTNKISSIEIEIFNIAYMDNTMWMGGLKKKLEK